MENGLKNERVFTIESAESDKNFESAFRYLDCFKQFRSAGVEIVFNALHGGEGEDGRISALLNMMGLPYTGSSILPAALSMDKHLSKSIFRNSGGKTADWLTYNSIEDIDLDAIKGLGLPIVVKGNHQGSSVGLSIVDDEKEIFSALEKAFAVDSEVIAEKYIGGREMTVGILEGEVYPVVEIVPSSGVYDYHSKYTNGASEYFAPADIDQSTTEELKTMAKLAWDEFKLENYARIDFRLDKNNKSFFLEANTLPGMTELSLMPMSAAAAGFSFYDLLMNIITSALKRF